MKSYWSGHGGAAGFAISQVIKAVHSLPDPNGFPLNMRCCKATDIWFGLVYLDYHWGTGVLISPGNFNP